MIDDVLRAAPTVPPREDVLRLVGLATQIFECVAGKAHTVNKSRTVVLQHEVLRHADKCQPFAYDPEARAYALSEDVVHAAHALGFDCKRAQRVDRLGRQNDRTVPLGATDEL